MSQESQILNHMRRYGSITPITALDKYGCFRLAARIEEIRRVHTVTTEMVRQGNKRFARYRLIALVRWLKLYTEILDDPKMRLLAFEDRWHYVALLCCKAEGIHDERDGIWERLLRVKLGLAEVEFCSLKKRLLEVFLIDENWNPSGWEKRQGAEDEKAAERQRKYREKQKKRNVTHNVTPTSQVEVEVEVEVEVDKESRTKRARFIPPTREEVSARCIEMGYSVNPDRFVSHYLANGWKVGRNPMKCWKSALAGWQTRDNDAAQQRPPTNQPKETAAQRMRRELEIQERIIQ